MANQIIKEHDQDYRDYYLNAQVALFSSRPSDGTFLDCNELFAKLVGCSSRQHCLESYIATEHYANIKDRDLMLLELEKNGYVKSFEANTIKMDGTPFWVSYSIKLFAGEDRMEGAVFDITKRKNTEQILKVSEEKYRDLVENLKEIIFTIDLKGNFTFVSHAVESITGFLPSEIIGKPIAQFIFKNDLPVLEKQFDQITAGRKIENEYRVFNKAGEILWVSIASSPINDDGAVVGLRGVMKDITARKQTEQALKQSEEEFRSVVEAMNEGLVISDENFKLIYVNRIVCETLGYSKEELLGSVGMKFFSKESYSKLINNRKKVQAGEDVLYEVEVIKKDGTILNVLLSGAPVFENGKFKKSITIFTDITILKQHERILEQKVLERTKDLNIAKTKAEIANNTKTEFLANMSHELRTPIHHILNYSKFCIEKLDKPREKRIEYCEIINNSAQKMLILVDDLLDLSYLDTDSVEYYMQSNNMTYVFNNVKTDFEQKLRQKKMSIEVPESKTFIKFDFNKMCKAITYIIDNTLKYGKSGSTITVDFNESDTKFWVTINNAGKVIPKDELESIFDAFTQSSITKTGAGGTGLGLSICKKIIEHHGGKLWAEENKNGATVKFYLSK